MSANVDTRVAGQKGIYTFRVGGQLHHYIGSTLPKDGHVPSFAQIYVMGDGGTEELSMRQNHHGNTLDNVILSNLQSLLNHINPYAQLLKNAREILEHTPGARVILKSMPPTNRTDYKRYNQPAVHDIGAVVEGNGDIPLRPREVILHRKDGFFIRMNDMSTNYLSSRYAILFPRGSQSWDEFFVSPTRTKPLSAQAETSTGKLLHVSLARITLTLRFT